MPPARTEKTNLRSYWFFQLFAWGFQGVQMVLLASTAPEFFQWKHYSLEFAKLGVLVVVSHGIARVMMRREWFSLRRAGLLWRGLGMCGIGSLLPTALFFRMTRLEWGDFYSNGLLLFLGDYLTHFTILTMWGGFFLAFQLHELNRRSQIERARMKMASKEAELATLKSQLNPHFLFNSFNLLRAMIQREPGKAREIVTNLAEMMRHSLTLSHQDTIPLFSELDFVESYLRLEKLRYEERLRVDAGVPNEFRNVRIPSMLLYTLVENAIKYGIDQSHDGVDINYTIRRQNGRLSLAVSNTGKLVERGRSTGTGLANIRDRLGLLYGEESSIHIGEENGKVLVEVTWPESTAGIL